MGVFLMMPTLTAATESRMGSPLILFWLLSLAIALATAT
jgi:hypothetical protein